jgi:hypothetical protein
MESIPRVLGGVSTMGDSERPLGLTSKRRKNRSIRLGGCTSKRGINSITAKAPDGMCFEVGGACPVLRILETTDTVPATFPFALPGGTLEVMILSAVLISGSNLGLKKAIDRGAPSGFEAF